MRRPLLALLLLAPLSAWADRRETYTQLTLGPALLVVRDPGGSSSTAAHPALSAELVSYYGLTNTLHVGGSVRFIGTRNARIAGITVGQPDGSQPAGSLYLDTWSLGAAALLAYRYDTGLDLAPVARLELGLAHSSYRRLQLIADSRAYALDVPGRSTFALTTRALAAVEYRLDTRFVASAGVGIRRAFGDLTTWSLDIPLTFGLIW